MHTPVMLQEAVDFLVTDPTGWYVDGTFGRGGHSRAILGRLAVGGRLLAIDRDPEAVSAAGAAVLADDPRFTIEQASFAELARVMHRHGMQGGVHGILFDLGVSSPQLDDPHRGFSFLQDGPLDMRMDPHAGRSAAEWIARARAEIVQATGNGPVTAESFSAYEILPRIFAEALRLYPPAWTISREAIHDTEVGGIQIKTGTTVVMSQWVMHRHPKYWSESEDFDPDRFLPENEVSRPKFAYFPFGGGPRQCIGDQFAWMEGEIGRAHV